MNKLCKKYEHVVIASIGGAAFLFSAFGVYAAPPSYNTTSATVSYSDSSGSGNISDPVSALYNYPRISGETSGYATLSGSNSSGVPMITSGAYASTSNDGGYAATDAYFQTTMLVGSGTSGLANGTAVTLQLSLQLDGNTSVTSGNEAGYTDMNYAYNITSPDQAVYDPGEPGWMVPNLVSFGADVSHSVNNFYTNYYQPAGDYHGTSYSSGWGWNSNLASGSGVQEDYYDVVPGYFSSTDTRTFDTGLVLIDFQTYIGDTLNINSYLDVWADTYGSGSSSTANFLNTMQASIASPYVTGIDLIYGSNGSTVPVPAAAWLFGSGLLGLIGVARRKTRNMTTN